MPPADQTDWVRLGQLLTRRRAQISARYANRRAFASDRDMNWRTLHDIELAKRGNFRPETMRAFETAYMLVPGSLDRTLAGGELEALPVLRQQDSGGIRGAGSAPFLRAVPDRPLPDDDPGIRELIRDWPELETIWRLRDADDIPYPRDERLRLMKKHLDGLRERIREAEAQTRAEAETGTERA